MPDLADLYPGFAAHWIDTSVGKIFARSGGAGPPLMLLHGYAQSNVMWHRVAPALADHFTLVIPDLPGYGWSVAPRAKPDHSPYTKRAMAAVMIEVMEQLGFVRFHLAGHDRGGRVAYRLALDHPGRLDRLATLDIVPTYAMWHDLDARLAYRIWHWTFLALPAPGPENVIGRDPVAFWDWKTAPGTKSKDLSSFDPRALAHYRAFFSDPTRILENGEPVAVVLSPAEFDRLEEQDRIRREAKARLRRTCLRWVLDNATLIASSELLEELETRLARPKFNKYVDDSRRWAFVADLGLSAVQVELSGLVKACRDPDYDKLLEIAVVGRADCLVTSDQDLLVLDPFRGIPILTPAAFLATVSPSIDPAD